MAVFSASSSFSRVRFRRPQRRSGAAPVHVRAGGVVPVGSSAGGEDLLFRNRVTVCSVRLQVSPDSVLRVSVRSGGFLLGGQFFFGSSGGCRGGVSTTQQLVQHPAQRVRGEFA